MHGEHGAQVVIGLALELRLAFVGVDTARRTATGRNRVRRVLMALTLNTEPPVDSTEQRRPVLRPVLVHQPADRAADRVIDAGHAAGADGDEFLLRHGRRAERRQASATPPSRDRRLLVSVFHVPVPPFFVIELSPRNSVGSQDAAAASANFITPPQSPTAASIASPSRSTIVSIAPLSTMNGGASNTWSPRVPSIVPPIG